MKQFILSAVMILTLAAACKKKPEYKGSESPVSKAIEFRVAQAADYSASVYDGVQAEVRLSVTKENQQNGSATVLWDTTFGMRSLRQYPAFSSPLTLLKQFTGIMESTESLRVSRIIRYNSGNNQFSMNAKSESVPSLTPLKRFEVSL